MKTVTWFYATVGNWLLSKLCVKIWFIFETEENPSCSRWRILLLVVVVMLACGDEVKPEIITGLLRGRVSPHTHARTHAQSDSWQQHVCDVTYWAPSAYRSSRKTSGHRPTLRVCTWIRFQLPQYDVGGHEEMLKLNRHVWASAVAAGVWVRSKAGLYPFSLCWLDFQHPSCVPTAQKRF
jgi:hypothetical protein